MSKNYVVKGKLRLKFQWKNFNKSVTAESEDLAKEKAISTLGGNHGVKRFEIKIESVKEAPVSEP